jgi:demethylmacrocin O-methyltransferase
MDKWKDNLDRFKSLWRDRLPNSTITCYRKLKDAFAGIFYQFNLSKLARFYDTDKWGRHSYTPNYQFFFSKFKFKRIKLLEIGVGGYDKPEKGGKSLRMWKKYFPFGHIYSIDIYDKNKLEENRIHIFQGSQIDEEFLSSLINKIGRPDIIIDDGSHINEHVIKSFEILFPYLNPGGMYAIEDTETSYMDDYGGDSVNIDNPNTSMNYFKSIPDRINNDRFEMDDYQKISFENDIRSIHFFHELIIIEKSSY